jgi:hypothetical protein
VTFDQSGAGLKSRDGGALKRFEIAGADKVWKWADAKIDGTDSVLVSSAEVKAPVAVRYAWAANPEGCEPREQRRPARLRLPHGRLGRCGDQSGHHRRERPRTSAARCPPMKSKPRRRAEQARQKERRIPRAAKEAPAADGEVQGDCAEEVSLQPLGTSLAPGLAGTQTCGQGFCQLLGGRFDEQVEQPGKQQAGGDPTAPQHHFGSG